MGIEEKDRHECGLCGGECDLPALLLGCLGCSECQAELDSIDQVRMSADPDTDRRLKAVAREILDPMAAVERIMDEAASRHGLIRKGRRI